MVRVAQELGRYYEVFSLVDAGVEQFLEDDADVELVVVGRGSVEVAVADA